MSRLFGVTSGAWLTIILLIIGQVTHSDGGFLPPNDKQTKCNGLTFCGFYSVSLCLPKCNKISLMWVSNTVQQKFFNRLLSRPQNIKCADCGSKSPSWASIDFGVLVCLNCSGAHRALGPSVTRVKSTKLDTWMSDWFEYMTCGNEACNLYWEGNIGLNKKPNSNSTLDQIKKFVQEKYLKRRFVLPGHKDPITLMREGQNAVVQVEPKATVPPKSPKKSNSDEIEKASQQSNPDDNNLLDFDDEPTSKPSGESITSAKQTKKLEVDLMDFSAEPIALKKSHSVEPIHHLSHQLYQTPVPHIQNQHSYQQHHPYYTHAHQPVVHNNFHFGHFGQPQPHQQQHPQPQHQPTNLITYGQSGFSANLQHNPNVGYMMHTNNFQSAPQPISMNMNINMYANNINLNIHPEPMLKMTDPEKKDKKKEDAFAGFDEFKL